MLFLIRQHLFDNAGCWLNRRHCDVWMCWKLCFRSTQVNYHSFIQRTEHVNTDHKSLILPWRQVKEENYRSSLFTALPMFMVRGRQSYWKLAQNPRWLPLSRASSGVNLNNLVSHCETLWSQHRLFTLIRTALPVLPPLFGRAHGVWESCVCVCVRALFTIYGM